MVLSLILVFFSFKERLPSWVKVVENLHAKIYVVDDTVFLTSANLTSGGMTRNIEFLVKVPLGEDVKRWIKKLDLLS